MVPCLIALGTNLGDRESHLRGGLAALRDDAAFVLVATSSVYETDPVGGPRQGPYLNACALFATDLDPLRVLDRLLAAEAAFGRERRVRWGPRTLDLDLLLLGRHVVETPRLRLPHPRMIERLFVMIPAAEVAPHLLHPVMGRSLRALRPPGSAAVRLLHGPEWLAAR